MRKNLLLYLIFVPFFSFAQKHYPSNVEVVLAQTKTNRHELEKAIQHFSKSQDSAKLEALYFLIANMDIYYGANYYWVDSLNKKILFNELNYPNFGASLKALDSLKATKTKLHPVPYHERDIDIIKADFLINHINEVFTLKNSPLTKNDFEYLLPYRVSIEPLQYWQPAYQKEFSWIKDSTKNDSVEKAVRLCLNDFNKWYSNTYKIESKNEPLPRQGALQLLHRKKGPCEDIADLETFILRSQGIPATIDVVPFWATSSGKHWLNVAFDKNNKPISFDASTTLISEKKLAREPAKVIRVTYSKQANTLASVLPKEQIPVGFLQTKNYIDVTNEYWDTKDVMCKLFFALSTKESNTVFACVFNYGSWQPTWWGMQKNDSVIFSNMCKGAVFLPMYYKNKKLQPAGYPIASGYNHTLILKPDIKNTHSITLAEQANYLIYRPEKKYKLFYWDNQWVSLGEKVVPLKESAAGTTLTFDNVPKNALLLLIPEYTQHKERPFIITDNGQRLWW